MADGPVSRLLATAIVAAALVFTAPATARDEPQYRLNAFAFSNKGTPWDGFWQQFKAHLDACCANELDTRLLIRAEAGSEEVMLSGLLRNRGQFGGFTLGGLATVVPELSVILSPFLFTSEAEVDFVMDQYLFDFFDRKFEEKGLVMIGWTEVGWLNVYAKQPIRVPADLGRGRKLRSQASEASQIFVTSIGGDLLQLPFADVIPALQTGLIAGGEASFVLYAFAGIASEAGHYTLTQHAYDTGILVANREWFTSLPAHLQREVRAAYPPAAAMRATVRGVADQVIARMDANPDINIIRPTADDLAQWRQATAGNAARIIDRVGGEARQAFDLIQQGKRAFAAAQHTTSMMDGSMMDGAAR